MCAHCSRTALSWSNNVLCSLSTAPLLWWLCGGLTSYVRDGPVRDGPVTRQLSIRWETDFYPVRVLGGIVLAL